MQDIPEIAIFLIILHITCELKITLWQRHHTVNIVPDVNTELVIVGFEDQPRNGTTDNDFNDAVILLHVDPYYALSSDTLNNTHCD